MIPNGTGEMIGTPQYPDTKCWLCSNLFKLEDHINSLFWQWGPIH